MTTSAACSCVHFQNYDREWEEWIDLDEDFVAVDRERIKVVESSLDLHIAKSQAEVTSIFSCRVSYLMLR